MANTKKTITLALSLSLLFGLSLPAQTGTGLRGDYFGNTSLTGTPTLTRIDPSVNFEWGQNSPAPALPVDRFSVRWSGQVEAPLSGTYTFVTRSDDGVRLWVDGKQLIQRWNDHGTTRDQSAPVTLVAGRRYDIQLEYYEGVGSAVIELRWAYPGQAEQTLPPARLFPTAITLQSPREVRSTAWIGDLPFLNATNGWGPVERNRSNGEAGAGDGRAIGLDGVTYSRGLGVHARSEVAIALDGRYDAFKAVVGLDDEVYDSGSVVFEVWVDGVRKFQSPTMRGSQPAQAIEVSTVNGRELRLIVTDAGDGFSYDHADWADARVEAYENATYLSDLNWLSATNGRGTVQKDRPVPATAGGLSPDRFFLRGRAYQKGLGTFPASEVKYALDRKYERFTALVGVDDMAFGRGSVIFEVWSGAALLYRSDVLRGNSAAQPISVMVADRMELSLRVLDAGDGSDMDLADWVEAKLIPISVAAPPTPAPLVPPAATELTAVAASAQVNLTWRAIPGALTYNVYRGSGSNPQTAVATGVTVTSFQNTGLTNGTAYVYQVRGVNGAGVGSPSNEVRVTPMASMVPMPVPASPRNLAAVAGIGQVSLTWQAVSGAVSYNIYRGTSMNGQAAAPIATGISGTTYSNGGLTSGVAYFYKVSAVNSAGVSSLSNEAAATPLAPPVPPMTQAPPAAPAGVSAVAGNGFVNLAWQAVAGATSYRVYGGTLPNRATLTAIATGLTGTTYSHTGLTNGMTYIYQVRAVNAVGEGNASGEASAQPVAPVMSPPVAPSAPLVSPGNLTAVGTKGQITLTWTPASGATSYHVYRGTTPGGQAAAPIAANVAANTYRDTGLTDGVPYFYKVAGVNTAGVGPSSGEAMARPGGAPGMPVIRTTPGDGRVVISWSSVPGATSYSLYRGTSPNGQAGQPIVAGIVGASYANVGLTNGTPYFYRLSAVGPGGESLRSEEASGTPSGPAPAPDPATLSAFRLVRQTTFGPRPGEVERVRSIGRARYLDEQLNMTPTQFPDSLYGVDVRGVQMHWLQTALSGTDQLRLRVAFALSKIWAVDAGEVNRSDATVSYYRIFVNRAFGNYRDLMTDVTLNPAMGQYLNMLNGKSEAITGVPAVENFPRELLQLFTLGSDRLGPDGSVQAGAAYTQGDIRALSRLLTGWTFGDGNPASVPSAAASQNWRVPMEPVERFHDVTAKTFLGNAIAANRTARQDLDAALDAIFQHPNLPPFVARHLITQLVTSNPSGGFISAVASAFMDNGSGRRGDLRATLLAIYNHPEASPAGGASGVGLKLMEPVLLALSPLRTLNANVPDSRMLTDVVDGLGQKVLYPPSVFSYFSPQYQIRNSELWGPEFQTLTSITALTRANYLAHLLNERLAGRATLDLAPYLSRAGDAAALTDYAALQLMGGAISTEQRTAIITAVNDSPTDQLERVRTALYLILTSAQYQVDR